MNAADLAIGAQYELLLGELRRLLHSATCSPSVPPGTFERLAARFVDEQLVALGLLAESDVDGEPASPEHRTMRWLSGCDHETIAAVLSLLHAAAEGVTA